MLDLNIQPDGSSKDSILDLSATAASPEPSPPASCDVEAVVRRHFDQVTGELPGGMGIRLVPGSTPDVITVEFSGAFTCRIRELCNGSLDGGTSARYFENTVFKILIERLPSLLAEQELSDSSEVPVDCPRKYDESLRDMLTSLREFAIDPCGMIVTKTGQDLCRCLNLILNTRRALFVKIECILDVEKFPYRGDPRVRRFLHGKSKITSNIESGKQDIRQSSQNSSSCSVPSIFYPSDSVGSSLMTHDMLNRPKRRSGKSLELMRLGEIHRKIKHVPIGPSFQANVPDWTGSSSKKLETDDNKALSDSRWLGIRIWPTEDNNNENNMDEIGKGRNESCSCDPPKSMGCIRYHIRMARLQLRSKLGQAFVGLGFDRMGEEVADSWSWEEQMAFDMLVRENPVSKYKTFWYPALEHFPSKSSQDLVSYYFNVHVLRRMGLQTRLAYKKADSDDDDCSGKSYEALLSPPDQKRRRLEGKAGVTKDQTCLRKRKDKLQ